MSGSRNNSRAHQALQQASLALRMQQFSRAEQLTTEVLKSNRTDRNAVLILAHALIAQKRAGEAIVPLERAVRRSSDAEIETLLGAALCGSGRSADGIEQLRCTVARRPPYLPAFQELAGQLAKAGQLNEAIRTVEDGLSLAPESIDLKVDLGRLFLQSYESAKARTILMVAHDAAPGRPVILTELALALLSNGEYAAAADKFRHVLGLRPEDALARANLARCLLEMGNRDGGEAALRSVMRGRPHLLGRAAYVLAASSHGRFFFRASAAAKFLGARTALEGLRSEFPPVRSRLLSHRVSEFVNLLRLFWRERRSLPNPVFSLDWNALRDGGALREGTPEICVMPMRRKMYPGVSITVAIHQPA